MSLPALEDSRGLHIFTARINFVEMAGISEGFFFRYSLLEKFLEKNANSNEKHLNFCSMYENYIETVGCRKMSRNESEEVK